MENAASARGHVIVKRREGERILIGEAGPGQIVVEVVKGGARPMIRVGAPKDVPVWREEVAPAEVSGR